ncbi:MAG: AAA family ATPase [Gallionella sp.]
MSALNIKQLKLRDYRCFSTLDIDFDPQLTVLIASNSVGKTAILDAIAVALGPYIGAFDEGVGKHFDPNDIRLAKVRDSLNHEMEYAPNGVCLEAEGFIPESLIDSIGGGCSTWKRSLAGIKSKRNNIRDAKELVSYGKRQQEAVRTGMATTLPLLAYYGTGRLWQQKKLTKAKLPRTSRTIAYADCLDPASSYKSLVEWFRYWSLNALEGHLAANKAGKKYEPTEFDDFIASVSGAVNQCLKPTEWREIAYSLSKEELVVHHAQFGELLVHLLSDGVRSMIGMVADIAFRATKLNPQLGAKAALETPGIVLIDEVDMHLHPEWQQVVLQNLCGAFPKIQFIVTTHSPQVLSSVDAKCIRLLREITDSETGKKAHLVEKITTQTRGVSSADLLAEIMGVNPVPNIPETQKLSQYHALIQQNLHQTAEGVTLRTLLETHFGAHHPVLRECDRMIRLQLFKQKLPISPKGA